MAGRTPSWFGYEKTCEQMRKRAAWERRQAKRVERSSMIGKEHIARGHRITADAYEAAAKRKC